MKKLDKIQSKDLGQYLKDIIQKGNNEAVTASGGAAVGQVLSEYIFSQLSNVEFPIWNLAQKVKVTHGPNVKLRGRVNSLMNEPASGSGIRTFWVSEADAATAQGIRFKSKELDLGKLITYVPATIELVEDVSEFGSVFAEDATTSMLYKIEREIVLGTGSIKGITQSDGNDATIGVPLDASITEAQIKVFVNKLHPAAHKNAVWLVSPQQYSAILDINFTTDNVLKFEDGVYFLFGFPIIVAPYLKSTPYNVILGDFSNYSIGFIEPKFATAEGLRFLEGETIFRMQVRICGGVVCERSSLDDGNEYGFFVVSESVPSEETSSSSSSEEYTSVSSESAPMMSSSSSESSNGHSESSSSSSEEHSESSSESSDENNIYDGVEDNVPN